MKEAPVIVETGCGQPEAAVIWLHGLGADGHDFEPIVQELQMPDRPAVRFLFPHAPLMPVTINNGFVMRAWFDIYSFDIGSRVDEEGIRASGRMLEGWIEGQKQQGIDSRKIVLAGFSQGGAIALHTGLRYPEPLAGIMGLSTFMPLAETLPQEASEANRQTPIFLAHGDRDPVLVPELAYRTRAVLERQGHEVEWHEYPGLQHGVSPQEIGDIGRWLRRVLAL
jgi:phospholipase/carboxylesterase